MRLISQLTFCFFLTYAICLMSGCENQSLVKTSPASLPPAKAISADAEASGSAIRFLEDRVKRDPDDFIALNKLAGYYLLRLRETGNLTWLDLAKRTANASLKTMPAVQNTGGLGLLIQSEFASHDFAAARDHARQLTELEQRKSYPYQLLGDALLELGDYDSAQKTFAEMKQRERGNFAVEVRLARLAALRGDHKGERQLYTEALALAAEMVPPSRETLAWCRWQLGEAAFNVGEYETAEKHYRDALTTFPNYYRGLAGLGKTLAARGDLKGGIEHYEQAVKQLPDPVFVALLGDLYQLAGRTKDAQAQFALCEQMVKLSQAAGELYNRQLALFYADHDLKADEAYQMAKREYAARQDIYGADALAWTALKAGNIEEAQKMSKQALRLGTQDAKLLYHAGMIAHAAGDKASAHNLLQQALKLNPQFDPRHAPIAKAKLAE